MITKQLILTFLLLTLTFVSCVFGLTASITGTSTISRNQSLTGTSSWTKTRSTTGTLSWTGTPSITSTPPSISLTSSMTRSMTISNTGSTSVLEYLSPNNINNLCPNRRTFACITWNGNVLYHTFNIRFGILKSPYKTIITGIRDTQYVLNDLEPASDYSVEIQGNIGTHISPWSYVFIFSLVDVQNGVRNIYCYGTQNRTVICNWDIGKNRFTHMRATLFCPVDSTMKLSKTVIKDFAENTLTLPGVPNNSSICRVDFRIKYLHSPNQIWSANAYF